jgi:hypothetical protein
MNKIRPELKPAASGRPGIGILVLTNWERDSLEFGAGAELCVQRNQDHRYLGEHGQWTATQTWHQVSLSEEQMDTAVVLTLDERLIDPLVENPQMTYQLQVRIGSEEAIGVLRIREGVLSSRAAGQSADPVARVADAQRIAPSDPVPPVAEPVEPPAEPVIASNQKQSKTGLWVALIAAIALLVAGFFAWKYFGSTAQPVATSSTPISVVPTPPAAPAEPAPCSTEALAASKDDLLFIQTCLKTNPDSNQVLAVIASAKEAKRCDVVQRLYAFKGQSGDAKVALAYAREFDPATFVVGCLNAADKETAIYWYELVLSKEPDNTDVKTRLEALRK